MYFVFLFLLFFFQARTASLFLSFLTSINYFYNYIDLSRIALSLPCLRSLYLAPLNNSCYDCVSPDRPAVYRAFKNSLRLFVTSTSGEPAVVICKLFVPAGTRAARFAVIEFSIERKTGGARFSLSSSPLPLFLFPSLSLSRFSFCFSFDYADERDNAPNTRRELRTTEAERKREREEEWRSRDR